ncbi:MAG TPA: hypothetical protein VKZ89_22475, partial [Thermobifida alba]|nr:hypothetical protein [Thermobifida alba]
MTTAKKRGEAAGRPGRAARRRRLAVLAAVLLAAALAAPVGWLHATTAQYRHTAEEVPKRPVALVLGA